jgi:hypothetical protein
VNISGPAFLLLSFAPIFAVIFMTGDFSSITGANLWISLSAAFVVGVAAGITVLSSGLSGVSIMMAFILAFSTTLYAIFTLSVLGILSGLPYTFGAIIEGFSAFFFVLGIFFITASPHQPNN